MRNVSLVVLVVASLAVVGGSLAGGTAGAAVLALAVPGVLAALTALAGEPARRGDRSSGTGTLASRLTPASLAAIVIVAAGTALGVGVLVLMGRTRGDGLPPGTRLMILGLGLLPLLVVPALYALSNRRADRGPGAASDEARD